MASQIQCFFLTPTGRAQKSLRRYTNGSKCDHKPGFHNSEILIVPDLEFPLIEGGHGFIINGKGDLPDDDLKKSPHWPEKCVCGYVFEDSDMWQVNTCRFYQRTDNLSEMHTLRKAPPGAMWYADWMSGRGPDGHCLAVRTPVGDWMIDGPSSGGGSWTRTGELPKITARPSIAMGERGSAFGYYHGFLTNGVLIACGDSES